MQDEYQYRQVATHYKALNDQQDTINLRGIGGFRWHLLDDFATKSS